MENIDWTNLFVLIKNIVVWFTGLTLFVVGFFSKGISGNIAMGIGSLLLLCGLYLVASGTSDE